MRVPENVKYDLSGRTALVTGAGRGQGRAHALSFARAGADVAIADIGGDIDSVPYALSREEDLESLAREVEAAGVRCSSVLCDVRDSAQVEAMAREVERSLGKIDFLVNNAGVESVADVVDMEEAMWNDMIDTNLRGAFLCCKHVAPGMIERGAGKIVNTASTASLVGLPGNAHYAAAKHGVLGLTKSLAIELAPCGINVNAVCPGSVDTPMNEGLLAAYEEWITGLGPLAGPWNLFTDDPENAMMAPEEISHAVLWLCSDAAEFVTGTSIVVDAGFLTK